MKEFRAEMEQLTKELVEIASVNRSEGERKVAEHLEAYFRAIPYFKEHPEQIIMQELKEDELHRKNVFAYIKGGKSKGKTLIFHGHIDTVGVEDFGPLQPYAFSPDQLLEEMKKLELPETVRKDLETGDWMVGRGSCDMKSGVAVFAVLMKYFSGHAEELEGNLLFSANPVEENLHTGIIEGLEVIENLQKEQGFSYEMAINNDYICPLYEGDTKRYLYAGAVGKLLPCFYIQGKETHVGQCFEGFDASFAAAELVREISLNTAFCDCYEGESTLPPSVLKMKDLKAAYNVQTAYDAMVYFNFFVHNHSVEQIVTELKRAAGTAFAKTQDWINEQNKRYCELSGDVFREVAYEKKIMTYEELVVAAKEVTVEIETELDAIWKAEQEKETDQREIGVAMIRHLLNRIGCKQPVIVLYFAPPYCPHNTLKKEVEKEWALKKRLEELAERVGRKTGETYEVKQFFPSLSDSSYLKIDDDEASIALLTQNFPAYEELYPLPLKKIKELNIPAVNFGVYGKDAHKWTERLYMPYSFEVLPELIIEAVKEFL
ncbi:MAG: M20/M25/M40 family metallo-hydrolase [Roseburia sp.]